MPLELVVDTLDSVPESFRPEYQEKDGKFYLSVAGPDGSAEIGLPKALANERELNRSIKNLFRSTGKTAADVEALLNERDSSQFETLLGQHRAAWTTEKATLESELKISRASEHRAIIEATLATALTGAKATDEGFDLLTERLGKRVTLETGDGRRVIKIMASDGKKPMVGSGPDGAATIPDLVEEAKKTWPSLFRGSGAGGGGARQNGASQNPGNVLTRSEFERLNPQERAARVKSGTKLTD